MPFDENVWPESNFEPLILEIVLPFFSRNPWKLRNTKLVKDYEGSVQKMWKDIFLWAGIYCRNFCIPRGQLIPCLGVWCGKFYGSAKIDNYRIIKPQKEEGFKFKSEKDKGRHLMARKRDHLMIPFQCERVWENLSQPLWGSPDCDSFIQVKMISISTEVYLCWHTLIPFRNIMMLWPFSLQVCFNF